MNNTMWMALNYNSLMINQIKFYLCEDLGDKFHATFDNWAHHAFYVETI